jgi:uncharacterized protein (TIGR04255 family)
LVNAVSAAYDDEAKYPNQPLSDVACEIRFKGDMAVECQRHLFWNKIRAEYSDIFVPQLQAGQAAALQHYKFRSAAGRTVSVALNSLAFSESTYSGHKSFIEEFMRLVRLFHETYPQADAITRVGWRYINVIPFSREGDRVPLERFVTLNISFPHKVFHSTSSLDLSWTGKCLDGEVRIGVAAVLKKDGVSESLSKQEALKLDLDFGTTRTDIKWSEVEAVISDARKKCRSIFEETITDSYREYLRGKTL